MTCIFRPLAPAVLAAFVALPAHAVIRTVPSAAYPTIQAGVNASFPGDTVNILPGTYAENVVINKNNLVVSGANCDTPSVIQDPGYGLPIFEVSANQVSLRCLTTRFGSEGVVVGAGFGVHLYRLRILVPQRNGIRLAHHPDFRISTVEVVSPGGVGVDVRDSDRGVINYTVVRFARNNCFTLDRVNDGQFSFNTAFQCDDIYGFELSGDRNVLLSNTITHVEYSAINATGNFNKIDNNIMRNAGNTLPSIDLSGNDNLVRSNGVQDSLYGGIFTAGDRNEVSGNAIGNASTDYCISMTRGSDAKALHNTCASSGYGIYVESDRARVEGNVVTAALVQPIVVIGNAPKVINNRAEIAGDSDVIDVTCLADCADGEIRANRASGATDSGSGISVQADVSPGLRVTQNQSFDNAASGIDARCLGCVFSFNSTFRNGEFDAGLWLGGSDNQILNHNANDNNGAGIAITYGAANVVRQSTAQRNLLEGIVVLAGASDTVLDRNVSRQNLAEGIDNQGTSTDLLSNQSSLNRTDCTNGPGGTIDTISGNACVDGSNFTPASQVGF